MKYILSEEELQEMKDEIQNAKEEFDALQLTMARHRGTLAEAIELCDGIVRFAKTEPKDTFWQGRRVAAMDILMILRNQPEKGDS